MGINQLQLSPDYFCIFLPIPAYSGPFQPIPVYSSIVQSIPTYSSLFQLIPAYPAYFGIFSLFQPIPAYSILCQPIPASQKIPNLQYPILNIQFEMHRCSFYPQLIILSVSSLLNCTLDYLVWLVLAYNLLEKVNFCFVNICWIYSLADITMSQSYYYSSACLSCSSC